MCDNLSIMMKLLLIVLSGPKIIEKLLSKTFVDGVTNDLPLVISLLFIS